jgi:hypothetical protein
MIGGYMAVSYFYEKNIPSFICLSTDVVAGAVSGVSVVGAHVFFTDTGTHWITDASLKLIPYAESIQGGTSGSTASVLSAGEAHLGEVGGKMTRVEVEFTNTSGSGTAYSIGDVVTGGSAITAPYELVGAFRVPGGSGYAVSAAVVTDKKSITPQFRVHFFNSASVTLSGDNLPYQELYVDASKRLRYIDLPAMITPADATNSTDSRSFDSAIRHPVIAAPGSTSLFVTLEALTAFTPATSSEKYTISVFIDNN